MSGVANLMGMGDWGLPPTNQFNYDPGDVFGSLIPSLNNTAVSGGGNDIFSMLSKVGGAGGAPAFEPSFLQSLMGFKDPTGFQTMGWGPAVFGMGKSLFDGWLGMEKLDLAKDSLNFQKDAFSKQFENQRTLTNAELRDRQAARVASNPTDYASVADYMRQNGV